ncbi:MAG: AraC family transcriptional regulator [Afipia sp.]|nr:AraC family transcriptional regulator [Afipia sp.]
MQLATIDFAFRAGTAALLILLAALMLRDFGRVTAGRLASGFAIGTAAFAISSMAGFGAPVTWWHAILIAISTGNVVVFWLFTRALFDDEFSLHWWHAVAWIALIAASLVNCIWLVPQHSDAASIVAPALSLIALAFIALAVVQTISSWSADLVEGRRHVRVLIVASTAFYGVMNSAMQLYLHGENPPLLVSVVNATMLAAIVISVVWSLTRAAGEDVFATGSQRGAQTRDSNLSIDGTDRNLVDALDRLISGERIYRYEGVTIGMLAARLSVPEYKLRRLINQKLGHRNFNVFLNNYRIEEAKAALADPAQMEVPVTTIALDTGFQSLGPFNRAFKTGTGVTPTEYRRMSTTAV